MSIMSRGKQLHSGMNSVQVIQPSIESFLKWIQEMEQSLERVELDALRARQRSKTDEVPKAELKKYKVSQQNLIRLETTMKSVRVANLQIPEFWILI